MAVGGVVDLWPECVLVAHLSFESLRTNGKEIVRAAAGVVVGEKKKPPATAYFPHPVARAVSSALRRFTSVFGMGTGGSTSL